MPKVHFVKEKKTVEVPDGANLRKAAMQNGIQLYWGPHKVLHCPGIGMCTTCRVVITKGTENVSPQGKWEKTNLILHPSAFYSRLGREEQLRLSCQTTVHGDIEVETQPAMNLHGEKFWA